jgi:hypothetical protein
LIPTVELLNPTVALMSLLGVLLIAKVGFQSSVVQSFGSVVEHFHTFLQWTNNKAGPANVMKERRKSPTGFAILERLT